MAREPPGAISANNILPVTIDALQTAGDSYVDIRLICGVTAMVARITRASCNRLGLRESESIFAIVKSVTVSPQIEASDQCICLKRTCAVSLRPSASTTVMRA